jgi:hypothetical protein
MTLRRLYFILLIPFFFACKKANERRCWKTIGDSIKLVTTIDSVQKMVLNNGLTYIMHQSNERKVEVIGGKNMVDLVEIRTNNYQLEITNKSYCHFLRDFDKKIVVHIYYPRFTDIYAEVSDSLIFLDTIQGNLMQLEMREAGGVAILTANLNDLRVIISAGPGHFVANGFAKFSTLKTQGQGFGDASGLKSQFLFGYQNSGAPLKLNLEGTEANIVIDGAGDIQYVGEPISIELTQNGEGDFIKY